MKHRKRSTRQINDPAQTGTAPKSSNETPFSYFTRAFGSSRARTESSRAATDTARRVPTLRAHELSPARRLALDGAMLCAALALSYIESILPLGLAVPLPGVKLGLANIVVTLLLWRGIAADAAAVSFARICLAALLFGGPVSFFVSLSGGAFAFAALCLCAFALRGFVGLLGTSVLCAAAHNIGQLAAVALLLSGGAAFAYLPVLLAAALVTGTITGVILLLLERARFLY